MLISGSSDDSSAAASPNGGAVKNPLDFLGWVPDPAKFAGLGTQGRNTPGDPGFTLTQAQHSIIS
jgi:hypothetical protein